jgi:hypothetical protein
LNEALELSQAMEKVKINSNKELESVKMRFRDARKKRCSCMHNYNDYGFAREKMA